MNRSRRASSSGHRERDRDRVVGQRLDGRHPQRVEDGVVAGTQSALKWSKGSRQARHTHSDLQAVEPKRLELPGVRDCRTAGSARTASSPTGPSRARAGGPAARCRTRASLRRPSSLIQSVVQAGLSTNSTSTCW